MRPPGSPSCPPWSPPQRRFVFDGGALADDAPIRLQESELDDYRFVDAGDLDRYLPPFISARVAAALRGRSTGATVYLPWTGIANQWM